MADNWIRGMMTDSEIIELQDKTQKIDAARWLGNLKKWQTGGLIGCAVGVIIAVLIVLGVHHYQMGVLPWDWVLRFHSLPAVLFNTILPLRPYILADLAAAVSIIIVYGGYGVIVGKFQQLDTSYIC